MSDHKKAMCSGALAGLAAFAVSWAGALALAGSEPPKIETGIKSIGDARLVEGDWGQFFIHFEGETYGTTDNFAGIATVKPGESVHPAHRHAEEEYLAILEGSGVWRLDGKEYPAKQGDVLFVEPWVWHGLVNTGDTPLTFFVVKWNAKGVEKVPEPEGEHGR